MNSAGILPVPYTAQGKNSGNCGPCCLKMLSDYYQVQSPKGMPYSVHSLNRLLRVTTEFGCEKSDMARVMKRLGLQRTKVTYANLGHYLRRGIPILALLIDESEEGHYCLIVGRTRNTFIFQDPYWGKRFVRSATWVKSKTRYFGDWLWAVTSSV